MTPVEGAPDNNMQQIELRADADAGHWAQFGLGHAG
jgi:hypothetical protein